MMILGINAYHADAAACLVVDGRLVVAGGYGMQPKSFSYEFEKQHYSQQWPTEAKPYLHLEPYLRCWFDPDAVFRGKSVLDIGAGECTYTRLIAERFQPKGIAACELFRERMLPAARSNRTPNLRFVAGDAFQLPFGDNSFDVVFASLVLSQLPNLRIALREFKRVLKPQGLFVGFEPNPFNPVITYRYFFNLHSLNQYLFWPWHIRSVFGTEGFGVKIRYFYAKVPRLQYRFVGTCIGMIAKQLEDLHRQQNS